MRPTYIYALINPLNNLVFYIGATKNLSQRLSGHCSYRYILKNYKSKILCDIIENGKTAEIFELEVCYGNDVEVRKLEEFYIELFRFYGFHLPQLSKSTYLSNNKCDYSYLNSFM